MPSICASNAAQNKGLQSDKTRPRLVVLLRSSQMARIDVIPEIFFVMAQEHTALADASIGSANLAHRFSDQRLTSARVIVAAELATGKGFSHRHLPVTPCSCVRIYMR